MYVQRRGDRELQTVLLRLQHGRVDRCLSSDVGLSRELAAGLVPTKLEDQARLVEVGRQLERKGRDVVKFVASFRARDRVIHERADDGLDALMVEVLLQLAEGWEIHMAEDRGYQGGCLVGDGPMLERLVNYTRSDTPRSVYVENGSS